MDKAKIKRILRWAGGGFLALFSLGMLFSFFSVITARDMFAQSGFPFSVADAILWWLVILGTGAPAALLLRRAILDVLPGKGAAGEADASAEDITEEEYINEDLENEEDSEQSIADTDEE